MCRLEPDHRIYPYELRMSLEYLARECTVERREAEGALAITAEDELHAPGTERTVSVIEKDGCRCLCVTQIDTGCGSVAAASREDVTTSWDVVQPLGSA
jgi:hypothetical protein